jgi:O-antigen/teichoic acid export membrane protein
MAADAPYSAVRLKRGLGYFISGKGAAALLGLINFTLVVQLLPVEEYAGYVTIIAALEVAIAFSTFGLDWAGLRYLPEMREQSSGAGLRLLVWRLCGYRAASLGAVALLGAALLPWLMHQAQLDAFLPIAKIYLCVLCAEGMLRFILGVVFDSLLLQAQGQFSLIVRNASFASAVALAGSGAGIAEVARYDLAAASAGLLVAVILLLVHMHTACRRQLDSGVSALPDAGRMRHMALHNYASMLLCQPYSPQALLLLAGLFLPSAATAVLGFARNLTDLIRRYQPVEMLLGLVRPLLISTYARQRDFASLARMSQLIYKFSLLTLCPVLVVCTAYGDLLIGVLAKQKYPQAYWLVVGLAWTLVLRSHRLLVGTMANILDQPQLLTRTSLATLVVLPVCVAGFALGHGALTLFIAAVIEEVLGTWMIVRGMRALGYSYVPPWQAMARVAAIGAALSGLLVAARLSEPPLLWLALQMAGAAAAAVALALASGFFDAPERSTLRGLAGLRGR